MISSNTEWASGSLGKYQAHFSGARYSFELHSEEIPLPDVCDVGLRCNPRRRFIFVSLVLGRHWPSRPLAIRDVAKRIAAKIAIVPHEPTIFIGMAETATTLGQAVFREWLQKGGKGLYIESTRRETGGDIAFRFSETHSHAVGHILHRPGIEDDPDDLMLQAKKVVIVDDEVTTASTAANLFNALRHYRSTMPFKSVLATILHWDSPGGLPSGLDQVEALVEGNFNFTSNDILPESVSKGMYSSHTLPVRKGARHGITRPECLPEHWEVRARVQEKILVVGGGEYGFCPLLLAEQLESQGALVWVQATTRSPILKGGAIGHIREFPALSQEGYQEYLYNVPDSHDYDRVLLVLEDPPPSSLHPIWQIPALEVIF